MSAAFVFTEEAENQFFDIIDHISAESEDAAVRVRHAIHDAASRLARCRRWATPAKISPGGS